MDYMLLALQWFQKCWCLSELTINHNQEECRIFHFKIPNFKLNEILNPNQAHIIFYINVHALLLY